MYLPVAEPVDNNNLCKRNCVHNNYKQLVK